MDVPPVRRAHGQVAHPAPEDSHRGVGDRQPHRHDREQDRERRRPAHRTLDPDHADQEADEHATAVPQEDAGRMPVIEQESRQASRQRHREDRGVEVLVVDRHERQRAGDQEPDAGGEPVHAVDEVPDVHAAEEPDHGDQQAERRDLERDAQPRQVDRRFGEVEVQVEELDRADPDAARVQRQHGGGLPEQLDARPQRAGVVDEPDRQNDQRGHEQAGVARHRRTASGPQADRGVEVGQEDRGRDAGRQRQSAQPGNRALVDPTEMVGPVDGPDAVGDPRDQRRRQDASQHAEGEDRQVDVGKDHESAHITIDRCISPGRGIIRGRPRWPEGERRIGRPGRRPRRSSVASSARLAREGCDRKDGQEPAGSIARGMKHDTIGLVFLDSCRCVQPDPERPFQGRVSGREGVSLPAANRSRRNPAAPRRAGIPGRTVQARRGVSFRPGGPVPNRLESGSPTLDSTGEVY